MFCVPATVTVLFAKPTDFTDKVILPEAVTANEPSSLAIAETFCPLTEIVAPATALPSVAETTCPLMVLVCADATRPNSNKGTVIKRRIFRIVFGFDFKILYNRNPII